MTPMMMAVPELFNIKSQSDFILKSNRSFFECARVNVVIENSVRKIEGAIFHHCVFNRNDISAFTFKNCQFIECRFNVVKFSDVEFHGCAVINCLFFKPKFNCVYIDPKCIVFDFNKWKKQASNINAWLFKKLETNYKEMDQDEFVEHAYINFRRYLRWQKKYEAADFMLPKRTLSWLSFFKDVMYDIAMLYGYGLVNVLVTTFVFGFFGFLALDRCWNLFGISSNVSNLEPVSVLQKIYFLVVTATTLGYGDLSPKNGYGMLFVVIVLLSSVVWTATVTAIIVKRLVK